MKTSYEWQGECSYIASVTDACLHSPYKEAHSAMRNFNHDRACFIRYCEMQRNCAVIDGRDDSAQYIEHCIDDLKGAA